MAAGNLQHLLRSTVNIVKRQFRPDEKDLFNPLNRWLWQEEYQRRLNTQCFDVSKLKSIAANIINQHYPDPNVVTADDLSITRHSQVGKNKVYTITPGDNERRINIKIPNAEMILPNLVIASEVATMDFARNVLKIPVPKVLAWGDDIEATFIITEPEPDDGLLALHWPHDDPKIHMDIIKSMVRLQRKFTHGSQYFEGLYGCLFLTKDVAKLGLENTIKLRHRDLDGRFAIGCDTSSSSRGLGQKGPWSNPFDYLKGISQSSRERIYRQIKVSASAPDLPTDVNFTAYQADTTNTRPLFALCEEPPNFPRCVELLDIFEKSIPLLIPTTDDPSHAEIITQPTLYNGLTLANIYIDPSSGEMTSLTDWQYASINPLYIQASVPSFTKVVHRLRVPELPAGEEFEALSDMEQARLQERYLLTIGQDYYLHQINEASLSMQLMSSLLRDSEFIFRYPLVASFAESSFSKREDELFFLNILAVLAPKEVSAHDKTLLFEFGPLFNEAKDRLEDWDIPVDVDGWVMADKFQFEKEKLGKFVDAVLGAAHSEEERTKLRRLIDTYNLTK